jgi:hypothetical protein
MNSGWRKGGRLRGEFHPFQQCRIDNDGKRAERHSGGSENGIEIAQSSDRDSDAIINEGPEQILLDLAQGKAREVDRHEDVAHIIADQDNAAGLLGDIRTRTDGDADIGGRQRGRSMKIVPAQQAAEKPGSVILKERSD